MSNDEEKEEEEVRREHARLTWLGRDCVVFFLRIRAFRCTRRAILDFFGARDRRVRERGGGAASRGISRIFSFWGGFFLLVMMPIAMCSDVALFVSYLSTTGRRTLRGGRRGRGARGWCARSFRVALRFGRGRRSLMTTF